MEKTRKESDSCGSLEVPSEKYWGAQTQRSLENFKIGGETMPFSLIRALGIVKLAAAKANMKLGNLDQEVGNAIIKASVPLATPKAYLDPVYSAILCSNSSKSFCIINAPLVPTSEKMSINFWSTSGMMASYYEMLRVMSNWLVKKGIKKQDAQKYITSLFLALSEDAVVNSNKDLKYLVKESQTPKGLNQQGLNTMSKKGVYKSVVNTLNSIHKRLNK